MSCCNSLPRLPEDWSPLAPADSDSFAYDTSAELALDGSELVASGPGAPSIVIAQTAGSPAASLVASNIATDGTLVTFTLTAGPAWGEFTVTIAFSTTTHGPIHRTEIVEVSAADLELPIQSQRT